MKEIPELEPWQVTVRNVLTGYLRARLNLDYNRKYEVERSSLDITVIEEDARIFAIIAEITFGSNAVMVGIGSNYVEIKYSAPDMFDMVYFHVKQMVALHESVNTHRWSNGN